MNGHHNGVSRIRSGLLRKASTHALISVCRWSGVAEGDEAKLDGVSTIIPDTRPKTRVQDVTVGRGQGELTFRIVVEPFRDVLTQVANKAVQEERIPLDLGMAIPVDQREKRVRG
jgi:hypothetical protein